MSKVLYISNFFDKTGWSVAAENYAKALDSVGVDVVVRAIKLNNYNGPKDDKIAELEAKSLDGCDVCIQHVLPNMMEFNRGFRKNIGMFASETSNFIHSGWAKHLNMMDEVVVFCYQQVTACLDSGVKKPHIVHHTFDLDKFQTMSKINLPCDSNDYIFYYIGEFSKRKNVMAIIQAFHLAFGRHDPVQLLLKVNIPGKSQDETFKFVGDFCNNVKTGMKLYNNYGLYKKEMILAEHLSDEDMVKVHNTGHCFVLASRGEACCIPAVEAAGLGKHIICNANIGTVDYLDTNDKCILVNSRAESCFGEENQIPYLYTADEKWENIDVTHLSECMREMFEMRNVKPEDADNANMLNVAEQFNYHVIGNKLKEIIDG